jgi:hypothetical protein
LFPAFLCRGRLRGVTLNACCGLAKQGSGH